MDYLIWYVVIIVPAFGLFFLGAWWGRRSARPYDSWPIVTDEAVRLRGVNRLLEQQLAGCQALSSKRLAQRHQLQDQLRREQFAAEAEESMADDQL
jgi:hypothetical protein